MAIRRAWIDAVVASIEDLATEDSGVVMELDERLPSVLFLAGMRRHPVASSWLDAQHSLVPLRQVASLSRPGIEERISLALQGCASSSPGDPLQMLACVEACEEILLDLHQDLFVNRDESLWKSVLCPPLALNPVVTALPFDLELPPVRLGAFPDPTLERACELREAFWSEGLASGVERWASRMPTALYASLVESVAVVGDAAILYSIGHDTQWNGSGRDRIRLEAASLERSLRRVGIATSTPLRPIPLHDWTDLLSPVVPGQTPGAWLQQVFSGMTSIMDVEGAAGSRR